MSACLAAVGLPPTVLHEFPVTDTPRYRRIAERYGMLAHEQGICGCPVHVEVRDQDMTVLVCNRLRPWLPTLLALSVNSAVCRNADSGHASWRSVLWGRWPTAAVPLESAAEYHATLQRLQGLRDARCASLITDDPRWNLLGRNLNAHHTGGPSEHVAMDNASEVLDVLISRSGLDIGGLGDVHTGITEVLDSWLGDGRVCRLSLRLRVIRGCVLVLAGPSLAQEELLSFHPCGPEVSMSRNSAASRPCSSVGRPAVARSAGCCRTRRSSCAPGWSPTQADVRWSPRSRRATGVRRC